MQIPHSGLDVGVAHPGLDPEDVCAGDGQRAEGVARIVETPQSQLRSVQGRVIADAQPAIVQVWAIDLAEDQVAPAVKYVRSAKWARDVGPAGTLKTPCRTMRISLREPLVRGRFCDRPSRACQAPSCSGAPISRSFPMGRVGVEPTTDGL